MRHLALAFLALVLLCGCASQRAQVASDNHARLGASHMNHEQVAAAVAKGVAAAQQLGEAGRPLLEAFAIIAGANARADVLVHNADLSMPAAADVPSADYPAPAHTADELAVHPEVDVPAPEPSSNWGKVVAAGAAALPVLLFIIGRVAPLVPGAGPFAGMVANAAWTVLAHRDQKAADSAAVASHSAAEDVAPLLNAIAAAPRESLPGWLQTVATPARVDAARALVAAVAAPV